MITYPYVSRVLGVANVGVCNFIDSIINYFLIFSALGIGIVGIREIARNKDCKDDLQEVFSKLFTINTISTTIALVVLLVSMYTIPRLEDNYELMWIGVLKLVFNYLLIEWFFKGLEDFKYVTNRAIIVRTIYVFSVFVFIRDASDVETYYFLTSATIAVNAIINVLYARKFVKFKLCFFSLRYYTKSLCILGVYSILTSFYTTFNVAFLGFVTNDVQVGFYTTSTKIHGIILMMFTAVTSTLMPRMASILEKKQYGQYEKLIKKSVCVLLLFSIPCIVIIELFAPVIIKVIAGLGYEGAILPLRIIAPLVLIIGLEQVLITQSLMPMGKDKAVLINSIIGAFVGIIGNIILVPYLESVGSAIVWLISEIVVMFSALYFFKKEWKKMNTDLFID